MMMIRSEGGHLGYCSPSSHDHNHICFSLKPCLLGLAWPDFPRHRLEMGWTVVFQKLVLSFQHFCTILTAHIQPTGSIFMGL